MQTQADTEKIPFLTGASEQQYECLLGTLPGVVYMLDEKGLFTYIGDGAGSMLGFTREDLVGKHFSTIIHPGDLPSVSREQLLPRFEGIPTGGERAPKLFDERRSWQRRTNGLQVRLRRKATGKTADPDVIKCKVNASGQYTGENRFYGTVGVIYDAVDDEMKLMTIEKARRYNAFDLLTHALSHVFSNVFTGIYGNLQLIEMQLDDPGQFADNLDAIRHSIENAVTLVKKLSGTISTRQPVGMNSVGKIIVEEAEDILSGLGLSYRYETDPGLWRPQVDPDYCRHIVRAVLFHVARSVRSDCEVGIRNENITESPIRLPRIDCPYIKISFSFSEADAADTDGREGCTTALERIASMALSYELLKKVGGGIDVSNGLCSRVDLYLPALFHDSCRV